MTGRTALFGLLAGAALPCAAAQAPDPVRLRDELRVMEAYLDQSVEEVSRPNAGFVLAGALTCRGYLLKGYGVVFVLPPRRLPSPAMMVGRRRPGRGAITWSGGGVVMVQDGTRRRVGLRELEAQVEAFQREALEQWEEFDRAFLEVQSRLAAAEAGVLPLLHPALPPPVRPVASPQPARAAAASAPPSAPALTALPEPPVAPEPPSVPEPVDRVDQALASPTPPSPPSAPAVAAPSAPAAPATPSVPARPPAGPLAPAGAPWRYWVEDSGDDREARTPERVVADTREAVVRALEEHSGLLTSLGPDETVTVVVDFVAGTPFLEEDARPARSLTLRVRKRDLDARRAGSLAAEELRSRVEAAEY
jgi:hypothetical protein